MRPLLLILTGTLLATAVHAADLVYRGEQTLWQDTEWSGEVLVDGVVTVAPQVTLDILPGTTVRFTRFDSNGDGIGEHELFAQGVLRAVGTREQPIRFTSAEKTPHIGDWGAINIMASEDPVSRLEHVMVEYGYRGFHAHFSSAELESCRFTRNLRGVQFQESRVTMRDCRIEENVNGIQIRDSVVTLHDIIIAKNYWGLRCVYSDVTLAASEIRDNLVNGLNLRDSRVAVHDNRVLGNRRGVYLQRSEGEVVGNLIENSSEHGLFLEESQIEVRANRIRANGRAGIKWIDAHGLLSHNDLSDNGMYALYNEGTSDVDARNNWWGEGVAERMHDHVYAGHRRTGLGMVDWSQPLSAPPIPRTQMEE